MLPPSPYQWYSLCVCPTATTIFRRTNLRDGATPAGVLVFEDNMEHIASAVAQAARTDEAETPTVSEFEELLKTTPLPDENLEVTLAEFAKIACGLLDVPVYDSIVESLHVLFSVYLEFTENVHFQQQVPADGPQVMTN